MFQLFWGENWRFLPLVSKIMGSHLSSKGVLSLLESGRCHLRRYTFTFVRDPLQHFLSGFAESMFRRAFFHGIDYQKALASGTVTNITVDDSKQFIRMLLGSPSSMTFVNHDRHIALMSALLGSPDLGIDFVGRLECILSGSYGKVIGHWPWKGRD